MKATWETLKEGVRVKCIFSSIDNFGKTGIIDHIGTEIIWVNWDDGRMIDRNWGQPASFEIIEEPLFPKEVSERELFNGGVQL